jgi:hypothetical protein
MTSMPIIDDRMVDLFRRTGKRRGSYRSNRSGRLVRDHAHVVLQRNLGCSFPGQDCITSRGEVGICDGRLHCMVDPFPGGFGLPH